jgi:universal stress protein A
MSGKGTVYRRILATVDLGDVTERVLARATGLGRICGAEVDLANILEGTPAFAQANGVDLIVAGSHGHHGIGRLLGSTADGILHRAVCDVLLVRQAAGA